MRRSVVFPYIWAILLILISVFSVGEYAPTEAYAEETTGVVYNVVVFLRFSDSPVYDSLDLTSSEILDIYSDDLNNGRSIAAFYYAMSGGGITIRNTFGYSNAERTLYYVYDADGTKSYWNAGVKNNATRISKERSLLSGAMEGFNDSFRDTSLTVDDLDSDSDGEIDSVTFVVLDDYPADSYYGTLVWPHKWDFSSIGLDGEILDCADGSVKGGDYNLTFAYTDEGKSNLAVSAHETGHVFGAGDYYNGTYHPADVYDLMDKSLASTYYPSYMLVYTRNKYLGSYYGTTRSVTAPSVVTLTAVTEATSSDVVAIKIDTSDPRVYIMAEFRINDSSTGYDSELPGSGVIVYKVDESVYGNQDASPSNPYKNHEVYVYRASSSAESALLKENDSRTGIKILSDTTLDIGIKVIRIEGDRATVEITGSYFDEASLTPDGAVSVLDAEYVIDENSSRYGVDVELMTFRTDTYEKIVLELYGENAKLAEKTVLASQLDSVETRLIFGLWEDDGLSEEPPLMLRVKVIDLEGKEYVVCGEANPYEIDRPYAWDEVYAAATYVKGSLTISADRDDDGVPIGAYKDGNILLDIGASISINTCEGVRTISVSSDGDFRCETVLPTEYAGAGTYTATLNLYYKNVTLDTLNIRFRILKEVLSVTLKAVDETKTKVSGNVAYMYLEDLVSSAPIYFYAVYKDGTSENLPVNVTPTEGDFHVVIDREIGGLRVRAEAYLFDTVIELYVPDKMFYGTALEDSLEALMASGTTKKVAVKYGDYKSDGSVGSTQRVIAEADYGYDYDLLPYEKTFSRDFVVKTVDGVAKITEIVLNKTSFNYGENIYPSDVAYVKYISYVSEYSDSGEESVLGDFSTMKIISPDYSVLTGATRATTGTAAFSVDGATYSVEVDILNGIETVTHASASNKQRAVGDTSEFVFTVSYHNGYEHTIRASVGSGNVVHDGSALKRASLESAGIIRLIVLNPYLKTETLAEFDLIVYEECREILGAYYNNKEAELSIEYGAALPLEGVALKYSTSDGEKSYVLTRGSYRVLNPECVVAAEKTYVLIEPLVLKKNGASVTVEIPLNVGSRVDTELLDTDSDYITVDYKNSVIYLSKEFTVAEFSESVTTSERFSVSFSCKDGYVGGRDYKVYIVNADGYVAKEFRAVLTGDADGDGRLTDNDYRVYAEALLDGADDYILSTIGGSLDIDVFARELTKTFPEPMKIARIWVKPIKEDDNEN